MYNLMDLRSEKIAQVSISHDGKQWFPARPAQWGGFIGFNLRLKDAWAVLTGKADAFVWPGDQ